MQSFFVCALEKGLHQHMNVCFECALKKGLHQNMNSSAHSKNGLHQNMDTVHWIQAEVPCETEVLLHV